MPWTMEVHMSIKNTFPDVIKSQDPWLGPFLMIGIGATIIPIVYSVACHFLVRYSLNDTYTSATHPM